MRFIFASLPNWFLAPDFLINAFSFLILLIFFILCIRNYRTNKNKSMMYLGVGFAFIAFAQLAIIPTKFGLYYDTTFTTYLGNLIVNSHIIQSTNVFYNISIFLNKALTLIGLYVIFRLPKKKQFFDFVLVIYFVLLAIFGGDLTANLFYLTTLGLFALISYRYYSVYRKNKFLNTKMLFIAFGLLALSKLLLIIPSLGIVGVLADSVELLSYIVLLVLIIKILRHDTKKEQDGHNLGYAKHTPRKRGKH